MQVACNIIVTWNQQKNHRFEDLIYGSQSRPCLWWTSGRKLVALASTRTPHCRRRQELWCQRSVCILGYRCRSLCILSLDRSCKMTRRCKMLTTTRNTSIFQSEPCNCTQSMLYHSPRGLCTFKKIKYACTSAETNILLWRGNFQNNSSGLKSNHNR